MNMEDHESIHQKYLTSNASIHKFLNRIPTESIHSFPESYHEIFLTCFESIQNILNRINLHPKIYQSIQTLYDTYQSSLFPALSFSGLNRFTHLVNRSTQLVLGKNLNLLSFSIYTHSHNTQNIESFASILSRSPKLIVHKFFKIKHFFL